jgi:uncharacterized membrane protein
VFALLALGSAVVYGAADFIGGLTSRRADTIAIVLISQAAGLVLVSLLVVVDAAAQPIGADWLWGGLAGLAGGIGVGLLYRALAIGVMAVVAPITAVCAVIVPVAFAIGFGDRPARHQAVGILLAMLAILLVSQPSSEGAPRLAAGRRSGVGLALAAGIAIGFFLLALANTSPDAGLWPLVAARLVSITLFTAAALLMRRSLHMERRLALTAMFGGGLDMVANLLYLVATRVGPLTLVVTLSSLYPASTVLLARVLLHERLAARQWAGVLLAFAAILLIVA